MSTVESYLFLFCDSFIAAFIVPISNEMAVYVMPVFGNHNRLLVLLTALAASVGGSLLNWWFGRRLIFLKNGEFFSGYRREMANAEIKWERYVVWLLFFASMKTVGNPLTLLAGFFGTRLKKFFLIVIIGKAVFYYSIIFLL